MLGDNAPVHIALRSSCYGSAYDRIDWQVNHYIKSLRIISWVKEKRKDGHVIAMSPLIYTCKTDHIEWTMDLYFYNEPLALIFKLTLG